VPAFLKKFLDRWLTSVKPNFIGNSRQGGNREFNERNYPPFLIIALILFAARHIHLLLKIFAYIGGRTS